MYDYTTMSITEYTKQSIDRIQTFFKKALEKRPISTIDNYIKKFRVLFISQTISLLRLIQSTLQRVIHSPRYALVLNQIRLTFSVFFARSKAISVSIWQSGPIQKIRLYALLIRFDKPIGTLLLLWPPLMTLWIAAEGWPDTDVLLVFIFGVFFMRSAGCAINDFADRDIDDKVARTQNRPLAAGKISSKEALLVFASFSLAAFLLVLLMNPLTIVLSVAGLLLAVSYPFMKRYHYLPQVHLGVAFGWAVPMAYAAQANELDHVTWLLFFATILWATAYDTMYAMVDRDDDIKIGVKSTAILFGSADRLIIGIIQIVLILDMILIGQKMQFSGLYFLGVTIASGFALYQQYLIKDRDRDLCFKAFLNNNWFGLILFAGVFLEYQIGGLS